jgi:hypothetical protein
MRYPLRQWPSAGRIRIVSVMKARSYLAQQEARDRYMTNQSSVGGAPPKGNIELVPKKKVLDFKLPPRLEQAGDQRLEQMEDGKHHAG